MTDVNNTYSGDQFAIYTLINHYVIIITIFYNIVILTYNIILTYIMLYVNYLSITTATNIEDDEAIGGFQARLEHPLG